MTNLPPYRNLLLNSIWTSKNNILNTRGQNEYGPDENETNFKKAIVSIDNWGMGFGLNKITLSDTGGIDIDFSSNDWGIFYTRLPTPLIDRLADETVTISVLVKGSGSFTIGGVNRFWKEFSVDSEEYQLFSYTYTYPSLANDEWNKSISISLFSSINIGGMYFEEGNQSTFCRLENGKWVINHPQIYNIEKKKMSYYLNNFKGRNPNHSIIGTGFGLSDSRSVCIGIPLSSPIYKLPVCQKTGDLFLGGIFNTGFGDFVDCSFKKVYSYSDNMLHIDVELPNTGTINTIPGNVYTLHARNTKDFIFSAETVLL